MPMYLLYEYMDPQGCATIRALLGASLRLPLRLWAPWRVL